MDQGLLGHDRLSMGLVAFRAGPSHVQFLQESFPAVVEQRLARMDGRVARGRAGVRPVDVLDAEHENAHAAQLQFGQCLVRQPVVLVDLDLGDGVLAGQAQETGVVTDVEIGPAAQGALDDSAELAVDPRTRRKDPKEAKATEPNENVHGPTARAHGGS